MNNEYYAFNITNVGYNHIKINKTCEDWSGSYQNEFVNVCIVADGHGSLNYPRTYRGSKLAVESAMSCVVEFFNDIREESIEEKIKLSDIIKKRQQEIIVQLEKSILNVWYKLVEQDFLKEAFKESELSEVSERYKKEYINNNSVEKAYGTTLIMFAITEEISLGIQIGDGKCVIIDEKGEFQVPIEDDPNCQLNITTSICDSDAIDEFRYYISEKAPIAVFCGTDGIEDSYNNINEIYDLYRSISIIFAEYGEKIGKTELEEYLPIITKKGSGDDVSIAGILNMKKIVLFKDVLNWKKELSKVINELNSKMDRKNILKKEVLESDIKNQELEKIKREIDELEKQKSEVMILINSYLNGF